MDKTIRNNQKNEVKIWDILIRIFHWILVICFFTAYLTEDDFLDIHIYAGYLITGLLAFRIIWGLIGTKYARFDNFIYSFSTIKQYLLSLVTTHPKRYLGHNPAGGLMILLLLISLTLTVTSGIAMDDEPLSINSAQQNSLVNYTNFISDDDHDNNEHNRSEQHEFMEEIHEFFANVTLLLVFIHVGGVIVSGKIHKENLVKAMITGKKHL